MPAENAATVTNLTSVEQRYRQFAHEYFTRGFNASKAYRRVYGNTASDKSVEAAASRLLRNVKVRELLISKAAAAQKLHEIDEDFVIGHWLAMTRADVFDYFRMSDDPKTEGHLVIRAADLNKLTVEQRQNVKKLKIRNTTSQGDDYERREQTIELEIESRAKAVENIAKMLGLYREKKSGDGDIATLIREAEARVQRSRE